MYKILIKRLNRNLFEPYMIEKSIDNTETDTEVVYHESVDTYSQKIKSRSDMIEYSTDDLEELSEKYKELLSVYTTEQLKVVEELDVEVLVSIVDG